MTPSYDLWCLDSKSINVTPPTPSQTQWFVTPEHKSPGAKVHNRAGELVAVFEDLSEAELFVAAVNGMRS